MYRAERKLLHVFRRWRASLSAKAEIGAAWNTQLLKRIVASLFGAIAAGNVRIPGVESGECQDEGGAAQEQIPEEVQLLLGRRPN